MKDLLIFILEKGSLIGFLYRNTNQELKNYYSNIGIGYVCKLNKPITVK